MISLVKINKKRSSIEEGEAALQNFFAIRLVAVRGVDSFSQEKIYEYKSNRNCSYESIS